LGETTILSLAATKRASLRTTVPMSIVKQFDLKVGDKLDWTFNANGNELIIIVRPVKN
jgi:bifunctional DNA-binding transcriptional regulator/antitoxin component of YhaV-PrlF toxin-antitoxin module